VNVLRDAIVGRQREMAALRNWLEGARGGSGRLVLCAGEPGIGKSRLGQELAGVALASGTAVAWGRCARDEGAPAFWPWRQVLGSLGADAERVFATPIESPEDRFGVFEDVSAAVAEAAAERALVVILDDIHWADEPSLLVLRHLAPQLADRPILVFVAFRDVEPESGLPTVLPDLLRSPAAERLDLRGFDLDEVREQLAKAADDSGADARTVLDLTGGNPLFVREVARAMADGTWRSDRPPRTVLDLVRARLDGVSADCRRLLQTASVIGRQFSAALVAQALHEPLTRCLTVIDEAIANGLVERLDDIDDFRFVHALTREATAASLAAADRAAFHRAVAQAMETLYAGNLAEHVADIARHWMQLASHGEGAKARTWALRAADDAVRHLAFEDAVRLYRESLALPVTPIDDAERCHVLVALGRAAQLAGDLKAAVDAASTAAEAARSAGGPELLAEAALIVEAAAEPGVNAVVKELSEQALDELGDSGHEALRARLLAQRSRVAFYDAEQERVQHLSATALELARASGDDRALVDALHARREACPGPAGRDERMAVAEELLSVAHRTNRARSAMWAELWRIDALVESGRLGEAADELPALELAVERVGGPVSAWHLDRTTAFVAQAQGRFQDAVSTGRRAFDRMSTVELRAARGAFFAFQCALARHIGITDDAAEAVRNPFEPLPLFRTMGALSRTLLLLSAGLADEAAAFYERAGPIDGWTPPPFHVLYTHACGMFAAAELGRADDVRTLLTRLEPFRGEHVVSEGVAYAGPIELALGRGALAIGDLDRAIEDLGVAAAEAGRAGARAFQAEARYHLAIALMARGDAGDDGRAAAAATEADRLVRALAMAAYADRTRTLIAQVGKGGGTPGALSPREMEVARLVAEGLTNRQIAERLVISERTAQNHVQHILTKLGFSNRSQIAAWLAGMSK
jgi:DNA-binding CsgD family transcriptional regulator